MHSALSGCGAVFTGLVRMYDMVHGKAQRPALRASIAYHAHPPSPPTRGQVGAGHCTNELIAPAARPTVIPRTKHTHAVRETCLTNFAPAALERYGTVILNDQARPPQITRTPKIARCGVGGAKSR
jgi:hypothetical protein